MKSLCFSIIYGYFNYENVAWRNNSMNKTKRLFSKQKKTMKIIPMAYLHANLNSNEIRII